jgi:hypothetical protein
MGAKGKSSITVRTVGIGIVVTVVIGSIVAYAVGAVRMRVYNNSRDGTKAAADMAPPAAPAPLPADGDVDQHVQDKTPGLGPVDEGFQQQMPGEMQVVVSPNPDEPPVLANDSPEGEKAFHKAFPLSDKQSISFSKLSDANSKASESRPCVSFNPYSKAGYSATFRSQLPPPVGNTGPPATIPDNFHTFETNCPR